MNNKKIIIVIILVLLLIGIQNYLFYKDKKSLENYIYNLITNNQGFKFEVYELKCAPSYFKYPYLMSLVFIENHQDNIHPYYGICKVKYKVNDIIKYEVLYMNKYENYYRIADNYFLNYKSLNYGNE